MEGLVDSSIWVDYFRPKTPKIVKRQVAEVIDARDILLCDPVRFEILRGASASDLPLIEQTFFTIPVLSTPLDLWVRATELGKKCSRRGFQVPGFDLLIAQIALHFEVEVITFDGEFDLIQKVCNLNVHRLHRAVAK